MIGCIEANSKEGFSCKQILKIQTGICYKHGSQLDEWG